MKFKKYQKTLAAVVVLALGLGGVSSSSAQTTFTFTAVTNDENAVATWDYELGTQYTFTFTSVANFGLNSSTFSSTENKWLSTAGNSDAAMWSSISGDGLMGSYSLSASYYSSLSTATTFVLPTFFGIEVTGGSPAQVLAGNYQDSTGLIGLGGLELRNIRFSYYVYGSLGNPQIFAHNGTYVEPFNYNTGYFASYYSEDLDSYAYQANITIESVDGDSLSFDITNISISSASAIPEPSTYTSLVGLAALGFVAMRRRVAA